MQKSDGMIQLHSTEMFTFFLICLLTAPSISILVAFPDSFRPLFCACNAARLAFPVPTTLAILLADPCSPLALPRLFFGVAAAAPAPAVPFFYRARWS
jgi:hypothetical protein